MEKNEYRVLIKHCYLMGKNTVQAKEWLDKCYNTSAPSSSTVKNWYVEFRQDRTSTEDAPRSGRPKKACTPENIETIRKLVESDPSVTLKELAETIGISKERVAHIVCNRLHMKKRNTRWEPISTIDADAVK